jgi:hypothetical protein
MSEVLLDTHCPTCKCEYTNIGHPIYTGAIIVRTCGCRYVTVDGGTIHVLHMPVAPVKAEGGR